MLYIKLLWYRLKKKKEEKKTNWSIAKNIGNLRFYKK